MPTAEELYQAVDSGAITLEEALALQKQQGMAHPPPPASAGDVLRSAGEQIAKKTATWGTGAAQTLAAIEGLPADFLAGLRNATEGGPFADLKQFPDIKDPAFGSADLIRRANKNLYQPETKNEERLLAISRGLHSMLGPGVTGKGLVLGGASGAAGQAAKETLPGTPWAEPVSQLAVLLAGTPALATPRVTNTVKKTVDEIGTNELERMKVRQAEASAILGTPTIATHFGPENTALSSLMQEIYNHPDGAPLREALRGEGRAMAREQAVLPGEVTPQTVFSKKDANAAKRAVLQAKGAPFKDLTEEVKPYYTAAATEVPPKKLVDDLVNALMDIPGGRSLDRLGPASTTVESYIKRVKGAGDVIPAKPGQPASTVLGPEGKPLTPEIQPTAEIELPPTITQLDKIGSDARDASKAAASKYNTNTSDKASMLVMGDVHRVIREMTTGFSENLKEGKRIYAEGIEKLKPFSEGPLNDVFPKGPVEKGQTQFLQSRKWLRSADTTAEDVRFVGEQVRKSNPDEFRAMVGQNVLHAAQNSKDPAEFVRNLIGSAETAATRQGAFQESINQAALAAGKNPQEAAEAAEGALKLLETIRTVSKGHENITGSIQTGAAELAGKNWTSSLLRVLNPVGLYFRAWAEAGPIENAFRNKVFNSLGKTLSTPEGIDRLIEISRFDPVKHRTAILGRGLMSMELQQD